MNTKVSIIVPNFNHAKYLPRRLDSVINQTYANTEIIILDDCSTDNSREIINKYAQQDHRIKTIFNTVNSNSPFKQWKKGIQAAGGKYIWIAESDDFADNSLLETLITKLEENPESDIAYGQSVFVNDKDEVTGNHINNLNVLDNKLWKNDFCIDGKELLAKYMLIINIIPNAGAVVFKRNLIENINWEKILGFKLAGDRLFWSGIFMNTKVCFVAKNLNYFRIDGDTVRSRNIYTLKYLKEIQSVVFFICNNVNASFKNKTRAVKQWLIYLRNAIKYNKNKGVGFYFHSAYLYVKLLTIYIR